MTINRITAPPPATSPSVAPTPAATTDPIGFPVMPRALVAMLIAAPACEVVEQILSPLDGTSTAADLPLIASAPTTFTLSVLIGLLATAMYIPALTGLLRRTAGRSKTLSVIAAAMVVISMLGFAGVRMGQAVELAVAQSPLAPNTAADLVDAMSSNAIGGTMVAMFLGGTIIGMVLLAVVLWRSHRFSRIPVVLLALFPVVDLAAKGHAGTIASHTLLLVALGWLAVDLARR